jgi:hypothetical protein
MVLLDPGAKAVLVLKFCIALHGLSNITVKTSAQKPPSHR